MPASLQPERELDTAAAHWQWALDAEDRALAAASALLRAATVADERQALAQERHAAAHLLATLALERGIAPAPWLARTRVSPRMLGLPAGIEACVFDLDGVLTDSGRLHAIAWADTLDPLLMDVAQSIGHTFAPFDRDEDYVLYFDGRLRSEGLRLFLSSRGIRLPAVSIRGLADRKGEMLERGLRGRGVSALPGARRYLQAASYAHLARAVVSASTTTLPMLRIAELQHLIDVRADAATMQRGSLRARPSPDLLVAVCRELGVDPQRAVSFTQSGAGVAAAQQLNMHIVGIADEPRATELRDFGATEVMPSLGALLDPSLRSR